MKHFIFTKINSIKVTAYTVVIPFVLPHSFCFVVPLKPVFTGFLQSLAHPYSCCELALSLSFLYGTLLHGSANFVPFNSQTVFP